MLQIVIASKNAGKIREILEIMDGLPVRFLTSADFHWPEIEESGHTYVQNALLKAAAVSQNTGKPALADDSGIEVDALDGLPGVRSARFAGPNATDEENNIRLASLLHGVPAERRRARYRCAAVLWAPEGLSAEDAAGAQARVAGDAGSSDEKVVPLTLVEIAVCEGWIATEPKGAGGFGYDPWFVPEGHSRRMAELPEAEKNAISHRGKAFRGLRKQLEALLRPSA